MFPVNLWVHFYEVTNKFTILIMIPICCTDSITNHFADAINEKMGRMGSDAISGASFAINIQKDWKRRIFFGDEFFYDAFRFGNIYGQYNKAFVFKFIIQFC